MGANMLLEFGFKFKILGACWTLEKTFSLVLFQSSYIHQLQLKTGNFVVNHHKLISENT